MISSRSGKVDLLQGEWRCCDGFFAQRHGKAAGASRCDRNRCKVSGAVDSLRLSAGADLAAQKHQSRTYRRNIDFVISDADMERLAQVEEIQSLDL